mgnify:CR=1 FL=1
MQTIGIFVFWNFLSHSYFDLQWRFWASVKNKDESILQFKDLWESSRILLEREELKSSADAPIPMDHREIWT